MMSVIFFFVQVKIPVGLFGGLCNSFGMPNQKNNPFIAG